MCNIDYHITLRVLNFAKLHCVLKDLFIKEKWLLFLPHGVDVIKAYTRYSK